MDHWLTTISVTNENGERILPAESHRKAELPRIAVFAGLAFLLGYMFWQTLRHPDPAHSGLVASAYQDARIRVDYFTACAAPGSKPSKADADRIAVTEAYRALRKRLAETRFEPALLQVDYMIQDDRLELTRHGSHTLPFCQRNGYLAGMGREEVELALSEVERIAAAN